MLAKKYRVDKKNVDLVFKKGKSITSPLFHFKFILTTSAGLPRLSFIAPKNVAKLAVHRNSLRRHGYQALEKHISQFPIGLVGVFVFKKFQVPPIRSKPLADISIIENEIKNILNKIN